MRCYGPGSGDDMNYVLRQSLLYSPGGADRLYVDYFVLVLGAQGVLIYYAEGIVSHGPPSIWFDFCISVNFVSKEAYDF